MVSAITVIYDLAIAVFAGIIVSALVFAWEHGKRIRAEKETRGNKKVYRLDGPLFFASATSFKDLFDFRNDPDDVVIDFKKSRVCDHSAIEAINNITERYAQYGKRLHLLNLSDDCYKLIKKADNIVEVSVIDKIIWPVADDRLR